MKGKKSIAKKEGKRAKLLKRIFVLNIGSLEMNLKGVPKYISQQRDWKRRKLMATHSVYTEN